MVSRRYRRGLHGAAGGGDPRDDAELREQSAHDVENGGAGEATRSASVRRGRAQRPGQPLELGAILGGVRGALQAGRLGGDGVGADRAAGARDAVRVAAQVADVAVVQGLPKRVEVLAERREVAGDDVEVELRVAAGQLVERDGVDRRLGTARRSAFGAPAGASGSQRRRVCASITSVAGLTTRSSMPAAGSARARRSARSPSAPRSARAAVRRPAPARAARASS